ncbi:Phospholipase/lecithinase/hemolysin [Pseudomonas chlororaphis]|uniref:Phospholipase/lecithinase/hemolysin n=1 Tax=Pseudomonas chlororaphis TaxID=587753 RepID=A0A3G7TJG2_9PSED|nr:SGNH/GDSL hydrolase family protein [Pseudomonas chlororaphis]AZE47214.1 Phospholipase/lecithinase/hemolysin [Pseudomonas chlororaphis]
MRQILLAPLLALSLVAGSCLAGPSFDHLYAFGDSYSDNGASDRLTRDMLAQQFKDAQQLPGELYWQGRWSNGPTAVEVLAKSLRLPLTDHAVGGAKSGQNNYYAWMTAYRDTGVSGQIDDYLANAKGQADPRALYFIFISANDFFEHADFGHQEPVDELAASSIGHIQNAVSRLAKTGARHFLVVGSTDLRHAPAVVASGQREQALRYQRILERQLPSLLVAESKKLNVKITYFDHIAFSDQLRRQPAEHGLTQLDRPCQPTYPEVKPACAHPDEYFYWDEWHPTRKVHALVGEAMAKTLGQAR